MNYKGYRIEPLGTFSMYEIRALGQGQIPVDLYGYYTSAVMAQKAIDRSLNSLIKSRKVKHVEKESASPS